MTALDCLLYDCLSGFVGFGILICTCILSFVLCLRGVACFVLRLRVLLWVLGLMFPDLWVVYVLCVRGSIWGFGLNLSDVIVVFVLVLRFFGLLCLFAVLW